MLSTCSRPLAELLKTRICPFSTTYSPEHGSPSVKTVSPGEHCRATVRCTRKLSSESVSFSALHEETQFGIREPRENGNLRQCPAVIRACFRHGDHCSRSGVCDIAMEGSLVFAGDGRFPSVVRTPG